MLRRLCLAVSASLVLSLPAVAQPVLRPGADANFGEVQLGSGFLPDPLQVAVSAGGPLDASSFGGDCVGWVPEAATFDVFYQPDDDARNPLVFSAISDRTDLVLAVREPSGAWHCNDDSNGTNPMVRIENTYYGIWGVWLGTYEVSAEWPATLYVSEVSAGWEDFYYAPEEPNRELDSAERMFLDMYGEFPDARATLVAGFTPDPFTATVSAGGTRQAPGCPGFIGDGLPDFVLSYTAGDYPLVFTTYSDTDTTLLVRSFNGGTYCSDDEIGHDPLVSIPSPITGVYAVYVGTYSQTPTPISVRLDISEYADLR